MRFSGKARIWTFLVVAILLLIAIVLFIFANFNDLSITGFAGQEPDSLNNNVLSENLGPTIQEPPQPPPIPEEEPIPDGSGSSVGGGVFVGNSARSSSGGDGRGSGLSGGSSEGFGLSNQSQSNQTNQGNQSNQTTQDSKKKLKKLPFGLDLKYNGFLLSEGSEFQGKFRFGLEKGNKKISYFDIEFDGDDVDLSDIVGDSDFGLGKAFMHHTNGVLENISLYVPIKPGDVAVIVCSNASSYEEIYYGCSELPHITNEEILYLNNSRIEISLDGLYFIVHGITGTGATGVNVSIIGTSTTDATPPGEDPNAIAGNITELLFPTGVSGITKSWQGYFGNVTGTIVLEDSSNHTMYNWTLTSPEGVLLASTNSSILWNNIQCFNFTASGNYTSEQTGSAGGINLFGTNLTQLENLYNIDSNHVDGVDETFTLSGAGTHNLFYVNNNEFEEGECKNTRIFNHAGFGEDDKFEEALLYEPTSYSVVFAGLLNDNLLGFDNRLHDFEMIVLEDGHGTDTDTTTYYFYAAIS